MKSKLLLVFLLMYLGEQGFGQTLTNFKITPSSPTTDDSIAVDFLLVFPWFEAKKQTSNLAIGADTIVYTGCYYKPGFAQMDTYVYDTFNLGKLSAGYYELFVLRNFVLSYQDTDCINIAYTDTLDTFFIVSAANVILPTQHNGFQVMLLDFNRLKILSDAATKTSVNVFDALGRLCFTQQNISLPAGISQVDLIIPSLPRGMYFYDIKTENSRSVSKYIVH